MAVPTAMVFPRSAQQIFPYTSLARLGYLPIPGPVSWMASIQPPDQHCALNIPRRPIKDYQEGLQGSHLPGLISATGGSQQQVGGRETVMGPMGATPLTPSLSGTSGGVRTSLLSRRLPLPDSPQVYDGLPDPFGHGKVMALWLRVCGSFSTPRITMDALNPEDPFGQKHPRAEPPERGWHLGTS